MERNKMEDLDVNEIIDLIDDSSDIKKEDKEKIKDILDEARWQKQKKICSDVLNKLSVCLSIDDYKGIKKMLELSPAGDDMGDDNMIICLGHEGEYNRPISLGDLLDKLCRHYLGENEEYEEYEG